MITIVDNKDIIKRYGEIIKKLSHAGWKPITYAKTSDDEVLVERFGSDPLSSIYFTVRNTSSKTKTVEINCDLIDLGLVNGFYEAREILFSKNIKLKNSSITLEVAADEVAVLELKASNNLDIN